MFKGFMVDGKPFYSVGGQVHNASSDQIKNLEWGIRAVQAVKGNTIAVPLYWYKLEPQEGVYDMSQVLDVLQRVRKAGLKLVFLWFGAAKNATIKYAPAYVKEDMGRFERVIDQCGEPGVILSPYCRATIEADKACFVRVMRTIHACDKDGTVLSVQVENEVGAGHVTGRDWGKTATEAYEGPVPQELLQFIAARGCGQPYDAWRAMGSPASGSWAEVFGKHGAEYAMAWAYARAIDEIAAAGKAEHDVMMYVNAALDQNKWNFAGVNYSAGGPVSTVIDVYRCGAPHIDVVAPDIYRTDDVIYDYFMRAYARDDNPLYIPESGTGYANERMIFKAIAEYDSIGHHVFGIERYIDADGNLEADTLPMAKSLRIVANACPLINRFRGTGNIRYIAQRYGQTEERVDMGDWLGWVQFGYTTEGGRTGTDYLHRHMDECQPEWGRGLIFVAGPSEFYVVGDAFRIFLRRKDWPRDGRVRAVDAIEHIQGRVVNYTVHTEGLFDECGEYVVNRDRNGDEDDFGIWVTEDVGVVHVKVTD